MSYKITISSGVQPIGDDTLEMILSFDVDTAGSNQSYSFVNAGLRVAEWGDIVLSYDLEDALLVPATYSCSLFDTNDYLAELLFGHGAEAQACDKRAKIIIKINGAIEYEGKVQEDGISYDVSRKRIDLQIDSNTQIVNLKKLYNERAGDDSDKFYNPLGLTGYNVSSYFDAGNFYFIHEILEKIYQLVDSSISFSTGSLEIVHDWSFSGLRVDPADSNSLANIQLTELKQNIIPLFFDTTKGLSNLGDVLKKYALDWCAFTGMTSKGKAFFKKLFHYNASNLQTLEKVYSHTKNYKKSLINYVLVNTDFSGTGRLLAYSKGTDSGVEGGTLVRDMLPSFFMDWGYYPSAGSNIFATINRSTSDDGIYQIYSCKDPNLLSGLYDDNGEVVAEFWHHYRSNMNNCRIDDFECKGLKVDFLKDFNYGGEKFQPISVKKKLAEGITEIEAIYCGVLS